tara:strand:+ start:374 stop:511 length:138 start_codon:yes stop_codon:yes gene_type:complete
LAPNAIIEETVFYGLKGIPNRINICPNKTVVIIIFLFFNFTLINV